MVPEAPLERTETGLAPVGEGWFVLNAREACWLHREGWPAGCGFEGDTEFPQVGIAVSEVPTEPVSAGAASRIAV